jgi:hypothetical protein
MYGHLSGPGLEMEPPEHTLGSRGVHTSFLKYIIIYLSCVTVSSIPSIHHEHFAGITFIP